MAGVAAGDAAEHSLAAGRQSADERLAESGGRQSDGGGRVAADFQLFIRRAARPGTGPWENRHYHLACHSSFKTEIEYWHNPGLLFITGGRGDRVGRGRVNAAAASGAGSAYEQFLAGEGELCPGGRAGADALLAGVKKAAHLAA